MKTAELCRKLREAAAFFEQPAPPKLPPPAIPIDRLMREAADELDRYVAQVRDMDEEADRKHAADIAALDNPLKDMLARAVAAYEAKTPEQKAEHDYEQRRSFVRGMCPYSLNLDEWCRIVDRLLPPRNGAEA